MTGCGDPLVPSWTKQATVLLLGGTFLLLCYKKKRSYVGFVVLLLQRCLPLAVKLEQWPVKPVKTG